MYICIYKIILTHNYVILPPLCSSWLRNPNHQFRNPGRQRCPWHLRLVSARCSHPKRSRPVAAVTVAERVFHGSTYPWNPCWNYHTGDSSDRWNYHPGVYCGFTSSYDDWSTGSQILIDLLRWWNPRVNRHWCGFPLAMVTGWVHHLISHCYWIEHELPLMKMTILSRRRKIKTLPAKTMVRSRGILGAQHMPMFSNNHPINSRWHPWKGGRFYPII